MRQLSQDGVSQSICPWCYVAFIIEHLAGRHKNLSSIVNTQPIPFPVGPIISGIETISSPVPRINSHPLDVRQRRITHLHDKRSATVIMNFVPSPYK